MTYRISLSAVRIPDEVYPLMHDALWEGKIAQSEYIQQFEEAIADFVGVKHCIAVSNGTMADAVAVAAMKEKYGIKRVVVPALTFIAQPNSVRYNNLDIIFADVKDDWQLDFEKYFANHVFDEETLLFPADLMGRTFNFAKVLPHTFPDTRYHHTIEDACESFGSTAYDQHAGTFGEMGTYSFFPSHTISTGEGGAIVTYDDDLAILCRSLRAHGSISTDPLRKFQFPHLGFNARMTSLQAVLGIALMQHIHEYLEQRYEVFVEMQKLIGGFYDRPGDDRIMPHAFPVEFLTERARDDAMRTLIEAGIECRKFFSCIPNSELPYAESKGEFPNAERIARTHLYLPCHQNMTMEDVEYITMVMSRIGGRA